MRWVSHCGDTKAPPLRTLQLRGLCRERFESPQINNAPPFHCWDLRRRHEQESCLNEELLLIANLRSPIVHICSTSVFLLDSRKRQNKQLAATWIIIKDDLCDFLVTPIVTTAA
jgi:hypothetical protein